MQADLMLQILALSTFMVSNMKKTILSSALAGVLLLGTPLVNAQTLDQHGGLYFGLGAGVSLLKPEIKNTYEQDKETSIGGRVSAGYRFSPKLAAEAFFADLGKTELYDIKNKATKTPSYEVPYQMAGAELIYLPFGREELKGFDVLAALGVGSLMADKENYVKQEKDVQVILGAGMQYAFNSVFGVRLLAEAYDTDAGLVTLGVTLSPRTKQKPPAPIIIPEPAPVVVVEPAKPEPIPDSDGDGVADPYDCCPNTAGGLRVNKYGCPILEQSLQNINFEYKSYDLTAYARAVLDGIVESLQLYPSAKIELGAHTDSIASLSYNQKLSQKRAESARNYIVSRGIAPQRITARGYGETMPIASNATEDGRFQNRRAELKLTDRGDGAQGCGKEVQPEPSAE